MPEFLRGKAGSIAIYTIKDVVYDSFFVTRKIFYCELVGLKLALYLVRKLSKKLSTQGSSSSTVMYRKFILYK